MHPRTPNIGAVARAAGVSVGTVSNALNAPDRLASETLDRVLGIIDELGYIRSSAGRTLIRNAADDFSLIVPDIDNSLFVDIARGAQLTAAESGQRLVMANSGFSSRDLVTGRSAHDAQDDFLGYFAEARSGGVLVCAMRDPTTGIARIRNHVRPIVVVNFDVPGADWCTVLMDNEQAGRIAVEHIADLGIEHAGFDVRVDDAVAFADRVLLPKLDPQAVVDTLALHPTCSSTQLGLNPALERIGSAVARRAVVPDAWGCCGFAGDRGMLHPELTESATAAEAAEVRGLGADAHASCNRTCEIGMTRATGEDYRHVLELLEEATRV